MSGKPTVISTFCGTGGSSLGYKWAGFKELLAIDFDEHAVECFKLNFPGVPCWLKSVTDVTGKDIMKFTKLKKGELDVLDGSPPCQGFSTAGKRKITDSRNDLFLHYCRLINELEPKVFVMENVTGMAKGKFKGKFIEIIKKLKSLNYNVKCKQMNSMYYGVPQSRERLIFIGVRKDLKKQPVYPIPSNKIITARQATFDLKYQYENICSNIYWSTVKHGQSFSVAHPLGHYFSSIKLDPNKPCPTLTKTTRLDSSCGFWHWDKPAHISIDMAKRLCSFPDDWKLTGNYIKKWARLGNAVMPKFMEEIAKTIKSDILCI